MPPPGTRRCKAARRGSDLLLALVLTGLVATVLGAATLRLSGHFLPLSTIAWGIAIYFVFGNLDALNRYSGLSGIPPISHRAGLARRHHRDLLLHLDSARRRDAALPQPARFAARAARSAACAAASPWWKASRSTSSACGLRFSFSPALLAGLSGWLYAHMQRFVNPTPFDIRPGIELLFMALVGGAGQIAGAVVGAAIVVLLKNVLAGRASRRSPATARSSKLCVRRAASSSCCRRRAAASCR